MIGHCKYSPLIGPHQIRKRGNQDAFFSLGQDKKVIQGLDSLIDYYRWNVHTRKDEYNYKHHTMTTPRSGSRTGLQHVLATHVPAATAPPESRLHGTENLLHRACQVRSGKYLDGAPKIFAGRLAT